MENRKISKIIEEVNEVVSSMTPAKKYISGKKLNAKTQKALSEYWKKPQYILGCSKFLEEIKKT